MACLTGETGSYLWMAPEVIRWVQLPVWLGTA